MARKSENVDKVETDLDQNADAPIFSKDAARHSDPEAFSGNSAK